LAEPVRLTPAWEETNLPNDELNFKDVTMEQAVLEMNPPTDWYVLQKYKRVQVLVASLADFCCCCCCINSFIACNKQKSL